MEQQTEDRDDFDQFDGMSADIMALFQKNAKDRQNAEERMLRNLRQFKGEYEPDEKPSEGSTAYVSITKQKVNSAAARMIKLLLPNGERNWDIEPTPVPQLKAMADSSRPVALNDRQETTEADIAAQQTDLANDRSDRMRDTIEDQLSESNYDSVVRAVIMDACKLGTGVMKGPVLIGDERRVWGMDDQTGEQKLTVSRTMNPVTKYVNPLYWFPDMSATKPSEREFDFELSFMTKRAVRGLLKYPHYRAEQVKKVLQMSPKETQEKSFAFLNEMESVTGAKKIAEDNRYHCIEYYGPIKKEWLIACGCPEEELEEEADEPFGLMLLIGGHIVMADIHPMSRGESVYDPFSWEDDESSLFGYGVGDNARVGQEICNGVWRMMMNNGGLSSGPQIIIRDGKVEPEDGNYQMRPHKVWKYTDDGDTLRPQDVMHVFNIPANLNEMLAVYEQAKNMVDEITGLPKIAQGEQGNGVTKTFQGMALLMESANINIARCVKAFDDRITTPHIARYYDWNMEFNPDPEIKGDLRIVAKGTTALLKRESKIIEVQNLAQMASSLFPEFSDREAIYKEYLELNDFDPEKFTVKQMPPDENAPPSPEDQAMAAQQQAQQMQLEVQQKEFQLREQQMQIEGARDAQQFQIAMAKMALDKDMTMEKLYAQLGIKQSEIDLKYEQIDVDAEKAFTEMRLKQQMGSGI